MVTRPYDRELVIAALRQALPYIRLYRGSVFVVKAGGAMCGDEAVRRELAAQVGVLCELGIRVVLVHGGGPQTTALGERLGVPPVFVDGRRVTSPESLELAVMALNGSVNTALLAACRAAAVPAIGLSGVDAGLVKVVRRPPQLREVEGERTVVDFGRVGDIVAVDTTVLTRLLDAQLVPVVSPIAADDGGQLLNVNADIVAATLARALGAEKLVFLTDTAGLLEDKRNPASLVSYTDLAGLERLRARGALDGGMLPKVAAAEQALEGGVRRVHMVGYSTPSSLLVEVFTNEGSGTLVVRDTAELPAAEHAGTPAGAAGR